MDLEKISITIKDDDVKKISSKCNELLELQRIVEDLENQLTTHNNKLKNLQERIIPELMHQAGVSKIKLSDGNEVEVKPAYYAKIPVDKQDEAFSWLRLNGYDSLIKNTVTASFDKKQDNQVAKLIQVCEENNFSYLRKEKVEPMTLKATVRERIEDGKDLPMDLFGVYITNKTKITKK